MTKTRKPREDGEATREAILAAAEAEFSEKGFALASSREICRRAGANVALVNRYFKSKENLYRIVAKRLFGDLGAPMTDLPASVRDAASWRAAVTTWVDDFLFMTIPSEKAQRLCAGLFRHEVVTPTKFHEEFKRDFGKPVYDSLAALLAFAVKDATELELWCATVWAQVSAYALADRKWHASFQPKGVRPAEWRDRVRDFICANIFGRISYAG